MIKVLFCCHGNICRSPMAEFVLKDMAAKAGVSHLFQIDSCAASREEIGSGIYPPARRELSKHGIAVGPHRARQITRADLEYYDYIYYMDSRNRTYLRRMFPDFTGFTPFLDRDVADPWYSGDFTETWFDIEEGCKRILEELL
ncbi:MAG: low molecular weight phosphotyrosine protein phosphatase [Oscillospiraceae bacterium]|nr:low molecular weight phosphotyrosine protein phosphatase [Oscillospiraceae bacterium]